MTRGLGLPQPEPMTPMAGPAVFHDACPGATVAKMPFHAATVGFLPGAGWTPHREPPVVWAGV